MARIFYSMAGEGRGHATRVRAVVESLRHDHEVVLFTPGEAHRLLAPRYRGTNVRVVPMPGLLFRYTARRQVDYLGTGREVWRYARLLPDLVDWLESTISEHEPDLVITDFEPALPRAARRAGVPVVSVDHQHFLLVSDLSDLPRHLHWHVRYMGWLVRAMVNRVDAVVTSSFYFPPLKPGHDDAVQVGVLLRPEFVAATPEARGHLCVYLRRFAPERALAALEACGHPARVYGLGALPRRGRIEFFEVDEQRFIEDLATCDALVTTSGNQLVGEALYFGKPVLSMPEARNFEQFINAHFLQRCGGGCWTELEAVTPGDVRRFLDRLDSFTLQVARERINGTPRAVAEINRHLPSGSVARPAAAAAGSHQPLVAP